MRHELDPRVAPGLEARVVRDLDPVDKVGDACAALWAQVLEPLGVKAVGDEVLDVSAEDGFAGSATEPAGEEVVEGDDVGEGEQALLLMKDESFFFFFFLGMSE